MTEVKKTESDRIWDEIRALPINVFGMVQSVESCLVKLEVPGEQLYVKLTSGAVLPALETTLGDKALTKGRTYGVEVGEGYYIVKRAEKTPQAVVKALQDLKNQ